MRKYKFRPGLAVINMHRFVELASEDRWIYYWGKPLHPGFYTSWQYHTIERYIKGGYLREAIENE